ncbi:hypothetical protein [Teredinibacter franksiae]|uniref:hypothetical protein n=1 Tax=Teredinibacter franksiae TaxID=2761453 RepID=UPI0016234385|nr:hypothetical protein [Teredinibacter franksiae]
MGDADTIDDAADAVALTLTGEALSSKEAERTKMQAEIEAFLASGGTISRVANNVVADPPKKPESNYGGQPI